MRACGAAPQRSSCSDRSVTRRHRPRIAPFHRPAPIKIILEFDGYLLCHPGLLAALEIPAPRSTVLAAGTYGAGSRSQRMHPPSRTRSAQPRRPAPRTRCVPIANENRLVVPDALATTIKRNSSAAWRCRLHGADRQQRGQVLESIHGLPPRRASSSAAPHPGLVVSGRLPLAAVWPVPCPATQRERESRLLSAGGRAYRRIGASEGDADRLGLYAQIILIWVVAPVPLSRSALVRGRCCSCWAGAGLRQHKRSYSGASPSGR